MLIFINNPFSLPYTLNPTKTVTEKYQSYQEGSGQAEENRCSPLQTTKKLFHRLHPLCGVYRFFVFILFCLYL